MGGNGNGNQTSIEVWKKVTVLNRYEGYDYVAYDTHSSWVSEKIAVDKLTARNCRVFNELCKNFAVNAEMQDAAYEEEFYIPQAAKLAAYCGQRLTAENYKDILKNIFEYVALYEKVQQKLSAQDEQIKKENAAHETAMKTAEEEKAAKKAAAQSGLKKLSALLQADFDTTKMLCRPMFPILDNLGNKFFVAKLFLNKKDNKSLICFKDKKIASIVNDACLVPSIKFDGIKAVEFCGEKRAAIGSKCLLRVVETRANSFVAQIVAICA